MNHIICGLLWQHNVFKVYPCFCMDNVTFYLFITDVYILHLPTYQFISFWAIFTFWLLWIMLLWPLHSKFSLVVFNSFGYILRGSIVGLHTLCLTFWKTAKLLSKEASPFYISTSKIWEFSISPYHSIIALKYFVLV